MKKIKIALISPNQNAYSETFIQAHKNNLDEEVKYYYAGFLQPFGGAWIFVSKRLFNSDLEGSKLLFSPQIL